jgi:hypothetical protein
MRYFLRYYPGVYPEGLKKIMKPLSWESPSPGRDLNTGNPGCEETLLITPPWDSVGPNVIWQDEEGALQKELVLAFCNIHSPRGNVGTTEKHRNVSQWNTIFAHLFVSKGRKYLQLRIYRALKRLFPYYEPFTPTNPRTHLDRFILSIALSMCSTV